MRSNESQNNHHLEQHYQQVQQPRTAPQAHFQTVFQGPGHAYPSNAPYPPPLHHFSPQGSDDHHRINIPTTLGNSRKASFSGNLSSASLSPPSSGTGSPVINLQYAKPPLPQQVPTPPITSNEVYVVAFKRLNKDYVLGVRVPTTISVGDAVIVSSDRGEDLGFVSRIMSSREFVAERFQREIIPNFDLTQHVGRILRAATSRECRMLGMKSHDEEEVLKVSFNKFSVLLLTWF